MSGSGKHPWQVHVVNPDEVSSLIQLEPSRARVRRKGGDRTDAAREPGSGATPGQPEADDPTGDRDETGDDATRTADPVGSGESARTSLDDDTPGRSGPASGSGAAPAVISQHATQPVAPVGELRDRHLRRPTGSSEVRPIPPPTPDDPSDLRSLDELDADDLYTGDEEVTDSPESVSGVFHAPQPTAPREVTTASRPRPAPRPLIGGQRLALRQLALSVHAAIRDSRCTTLLLTSPEDRTGKSVLASLLADEFAALAPDRYAIISHTELHEYDPADRPEGVVVIVDGPAILQGDGLIPIPRAWSEAFDGALVVVMGRFTDSERLETAIDWLDKMEVRVLGLVFNEHFCPPPAQRFARWRAWLRGGTVLRDVGTAIRTLGRSLLRTP